MKDLEKKEAELKDKFESVKREAMKEEAAVNQHSERLKNLIGEMNDLQAQYRLVQELKAENGKKK